jgi:hypothetical protein
VIWYGALIGDNYGNYNTGQSAPLTWPTAVGPIANIVDPDQVFQGLMTAYVMSSFSAFYFSTQNGLPGSGSPPNKYIYSMTIPPMSNTSNNATPSVGSAATLATTAPGGYMYFGPAWLSSLGGATITASPSGGMLGLCPTVLGS